MSALNKYSIVMYTFLLLFRPKSRDLPKQGFQKIIKKNNQNSHIFLPIYGLKKFQKIVLSQLIMLNLLKQKNSKAVLPNLCV